MIEEENNGKMITSVMLSCYAFQIRFSMGANMIRNDIKIYATKDIISYTHYFPDVSDSRIDRRDFFLFELNS